MCLKKSASVGLNKINVTTCTVRKQRTKRVFSIFSITFFRNISCSEKNSVIYHKCTYGLHVKYPLFFSDFNKTSILSTDFRKYFKYQFS